MAFDSISRPPPCFTTTQRIKHVRGHEVFRVITCDYSMAANDWLVHAKFGPCHIFDWQGSFEHAR